jgi:hypothetical protein
MEMKQCVRREWEEVGTDAYRLAHYWVKRACNASGRRFDPDLVSDTVCVAYSRYSKRRGRETPRGAVKMIQACIRSTARSVVLDSRVDAWAGLDEQQEQPAPIPVSDDSRIDRLIELLLASGKRKLAGLVLATAQSTTGSLRELGNVLDVSNVTVLHWQRQLRECTELWLAFPLEYSRYWSTENQVSRLVDTLCR